MQTAIKIFLSSIYLLALFSKFNFDLSSRGIVFCILFAVWIIYFVQNIISSKNFELKISDFILIIAMLSLNLLNNFLIHSYTFANILFFLCLYLISKIFSPQKTKFFWITILTILFLPIQEYIQIFIGTPMRFLSAEIISKILNITGFSNITQSSILIFENNITNIDYSCSGASTFWVILVFISLISFFFNIKFSKKIIYISFFSLLALFFLNTSRILILTVLYNISYLKEEILLPVHIGLGIINFIILFCVIVYYLLKTSKETIKSENKHFVNQKFVYVLVLLGLILIPINMNTQKFYSEQVSQIKLSDGMKISTEEAEFFKEHKGSIIKSKENKVIKIKIATNSWRTHHNPINCIKGSGYKILKTKTIIYNNKFIKEVQTDKGYIYYYFSNDEITTDDYYKRVFYSLFQRNKNWTLYEYSSKVPLNDKYFENEL